MTTGPLPTVQPGGTPARLLFDQYLEAAEAVREALQALPQAAPHPRDYTGREDEHAAAVAAHAVREVLLKRVNELFSLASHAAVQLEKRA